jgi:hypothetical protein
MLLSILLFEDLLSRVPESKVYFEEKLANGQTIMLDHGALRTVSIKMKELPGGKVAFSRLLEPLGYTLSGTYPLNRINMCGFVYTHQDYPADIPQYFVSELYPERFSPAFQTCVKELVYDSSEPLNDESKNLLKKLGLERKLEYESAKTLLISLLNCFTRQHNIPSMAQYKLLLAESAEMAWIATEGNAFNHATDRVEDLDLLESEEKQKGRNMKPQIEEGIHANIRQTAYRASIVKRPFKSDSGTVDIEVPGSFFEFIQRGTHVDSTSGSEVMDLRFDTRNAQGIFKMTENKA